MENKQLQPFQERLLNEYNELNDRIEKLSAFISDKNPIYVNLAVDEQRDLILQLQYMTQYLGCLVSRCKRQGIL